MTGSADGWIDITVPIVDGMLHGRHFLPDGEDVGALEPTAAIGSARVVAITDPVAVGRAELEAARPRRGERLLLKTRNLFRRWGGEPFRRDFVFVSAAGARYLAECGMSLVGVDYPSVDGFVTDGQATHRALLEAES
jgi:arylformamidase